MSKAISDTQISTKELMVGNYLLCRGTVSRVFQVLHDSVSFGETTERGARYQNFYLSGIEPIPLTKDWVVKLGAIRYDEGRFYLLLSGDKTLYFNVGDDHFICELVINGVFACYFNDHESVHQLQNLYSSLTGGKQLEIIVE